MSFRFKLALAFSLLTLLFTAAAGLFVYTSAEASLFDEADRSLNDAASRLLRQAQTGADLRLPQGTQAQLLSKDGTVTQVQSASQPARPGDPARPGRANPASPAPAAQPFSDPLPVEQQDLKVAAGQSGPVSHTVSQDGTLWQVNTIPRPLTGGALMVGRDVSYIGSSLEAMRSRAFLAAGVAALAAFLLAWLLAAALTVRLARLTRFAREVARTADTTARTKVSGRDEIASLASGFNAMLCTLTESQNQQAQLLQDASHELRTPLTSLKTNIQVLPDYEKLTPAEQAELVSDMQTQVDELTDLITQALSLAGPDSSDRELVDLRDLCETAASSFIRAGLPVTVSGQAVAYVSPPALRRAILNLLGNCRKFAPGSPVEIHTGTRGDYAYLTVTDEGPGFSPEVLSRGTDRFYRDPAHRGLPGSGLGLSIVASAIQDQGGTLKLQNAPGAQVLLLLPASEDTGRT